MLGKIPPPPQKKKVEIFLDPPKVNLFRERDAYNQGWGVDKFFSGSRALAPNFFLKWLRLLVFFFERLRLQGAQKNRLRLLPIGQVWQNILFPAN